MVKAQRIDVDAMKAYIAGCLDLSGYKLERDLDADAIRVVGNGNAYDVFLHTDTRGVSDWSHRFHQAVHEGRNVANIFYKETRPSKRPVFFIGLDEESFKNMKDGSLKNYSFDQLKSVVFLRDKEKEVLERQRAGDRENSRMLVYYQPDNFSEGGRTHESLATFSFTDPRKDYSHIPEDMKGIDFILAQDGEKFKDYRFSGDRRRFNCNIRFSPIRTGSKLYVLSGDFMKPEELDVRQPRLF